MVSLFADDTLIYLQRKDKLTDLNRIINLFCCASTAKFNSEKTEYLLIGSECYQMRALRHQQFGSNKLSDTDSIIKEGESMRTLGAWVGNGSNTIKQWNKILEDQSKIMETWKHLRPTFKGKELILKALGLRNTHQISTVGDLRNYLDDAPSHPDCNSQSACLNMAKKLLEKLPSKYDPYLNTPIHDNLDHTRHCRREYGAREHYPSSAFSTLISPNICIVPMPSVSSDKETGVGVTRQAVKANT